GTYQLTYKKAGYVEMSPQTVTVGEGLTTMATPLTLAPAAEEGVVTVWLAHRSAQAAFTGLKEPGEERNPIGTMFALDVKAGPVELNSFAAAFGFLIGDLLDAPYAQIDRSALVDNQPLNAATLL